MTALIRTCNGCGTVTALDLDNTPDHWREMQWPGQTVKAVTEAEARQAWRNAGPCRCGVKERDAK